MISIKNIESPAAQRKRLLGLIFLCVDKYQDNLVDEKEKIDLIAAIILCLEGIEKTLAATITPWEKRDYWIKVEKFNKEWNWISGIRVGLESAYSGLNNTEIRKWINYLNKKLRQMKIPKIKVDNFWTGCSKTYQTKKGCG